MKAHSDKGRFLIACAILRFTSFNFSPDLKWTALECILAYDGDLTFAENL